MHSFHIDEMQQSSALPQQPCDKVKKDLGNEIQPTPSLLIFFMSKDPQDILHFLYLTNFKFIPQYKAELVQAFTKTIVPLFATGKLKTIVDSVFTMDQIQLAHKKMESNQNIGKIVIKIATPQVDENVTKNKSEL